MITNGYLNRSGRIQSIIRAIHFLRAERPDLLKTEMEKIYSELLNNSHPKKFVDRVKTRITNQTPSERNWTSTVCIPYVPKSQKRAEERSIRKVSEWHSPLQALWGSR